VDVGLPSYAKRQLPAIALIVGLLTKHLKPKMQPRPIIQKEKVGAHIDSPRGESGFDRLGHHSVERVSVYAPMHTIHRHNTLAPKKVWLGVLVKKDLRHLQKGRHRKLQVLIAAKPHP